MTLHRFGSDRDQNFLPYFQLYKIFMLYQHQTRSSKDSSRHQKIQLPIDVLVLVQKNLATLNEMDTDLLIDDHSTKAKRNMAEEELSSTASHRTEQGVITISETKKLKACQNDIIVFIDDTEENQANNEFDFC
jgi:hypothetical protein